MGEFDSIPEVTEAEKRPSVEQLIAWGERALAGEFLGDLSEYSEVEAIPSENKYPQGEFELDDGVILDQNSPEYSEDEKSQLLSWIERRLGQQVAEAPVKEQYTSPDGTTNFWVFAKEFGKPGNSWRITRWQSTGEEPSFIIWSEAMVAYQEEMGYTRIM